MSRDYYTRYPRPVLWLVPEGEDADAHEKDAHEKDDRPVAPFYLSTLPVTNEQYEAFDPGFERSPAAPGDRDPALGVSWDDAAGYCAWYAELAGKPIRLPTGAEWRHACRAGTAGRAFWGDDPGGADRFAWHAGNSEPDRVPPLDDKPSNPFGLLAMLGGVWEWVDDTGCGGAGDAGASGRVLYGGSWRTPAAELAWDLLRVEPAERPVADAGFRIARSLR